MSTRQEELVNGQRVSAKPTIPTPSGGTVMNRLIAFAIWCLACVTTYQCVVAVAPSLTLWTQIGVGIGVQAILTRLERPVLIGKPNGISWLVLLFDTVVNAGGAFPFAMRIAETPPAQMIVAALHMQATVSPIAAAVLALFIGFLLAAAPESVWHWK